MKQPLLLVRVLALCTAIRSFNLVPNPTSLFRWSMLLFLLGSAQLAFAQPANDDCENPQPIALGEMISASTVDATQEDVAFAGSACGPFVLTPNNSDDEGIWYSFIAPAGPINLIFMEGSLDPETAILEGECDALNCIAFNDSGDPGGSIMNVQLVEGQEYLIFVEGINGSQGTFMVEACTDELTCNDATVDLDDDGNVTVTAMDVAMATCDLTGITLSPSDLDCDDIGDVTVTVDAPTVSGFAADSPFAPDNWVFDSQLGDGDEIVDSDFPDDNTLQVSTSSVGSSCLGGSIFAELSYTFNNDGLLSFDYDWQTSASSFLGTIFDFFVLTSGGDILDLGAGIAGPVSSSIIDEEISAGDMLMIRVGEVGGCGTALNIMEITNFSFDPSCEVTVTVEDNAPPTFMPCPAGPLTVTIDENRPLNANGFYRLVRSDLEGVGVVAEDNCTPSNQIAFVYQNGSRLFGCDGNNNDDVVEIRARDQSDNLSDEICAIDLVVIDGLAPEIDCPVGGFDLDVELDADGLATVAATLAGLGLDDMDVEDNCDEFGELTANILSGSLDFGCMDIDADNTITFTVSDLSDNESEECTVNINVLDVTPPKISCPDDITDVENDPGECGAVVSYNASAADNCMVNITFDPASGSFFDVGTTTVTVTATDIGGNVNDEPCTFDVTVLDTESPELTCPMDMTIDCDATPPAPFTAAELMTEGLASDNCSFTVEVNETNSQQDAACGQYNFTIKREYIITDPAGLSVDCKQFITVEDVTPPVLTCNDVSVSADENCEALVPLAITATDNCASTDELTITYSLTDGGASLDADNSTFQLGETMVSARVIDPCTNEMSCTFTITVSDDTDPEITNCPDDVTVGTDAGVCTAVIDFMAMADDNCPGVTTEAMADGNVISGDFAFPLGTTTVSITATDAAGNTDTDNCSFDVTVEDNEAPTIECPDEVLMVFVDDSDPAMGRITNADLRDFGLVAM
ncbi:MAG: HYR domain-containing protein, partial [Bacteroidota bacterium]